MEFPQPEVDLVISYSYLWSDEAEAGHVEGRKNRPCAIVLVVQRAEGKTPVVTVVPITHTPHRNPSAAIEIPPAVKVIWDWIINPHGSCWTISTSSLGPAMTCGRSQRKRIAITTAYCRRVCSRLSSASSLNFGIKAKPHALRVPKRPCPSLACQHRVTLGKDNSESLGRSH
jgi:hypothetical protein